MSTATNNPLSSIGLATCWRAVLLATLLFVTGVAIAGNGQDQRKVVPTVPTLANYALTPNVIPAGMTGSVRLSARITGPLPTNVRLVSEWGDNYDLLDAGGAGDASAGDAVYSAQIPIAPIRARQVESDVHRVFIGFIDVYSGATRTMRINAFAQMHSLQLPNVQVRALSSDAQIAPHVINIVAPSLYRTHDAETPAIDAISKIALSLPLLGDNFDFLNIVFDRQQIENRYHFATRNSTSGIGQALFNNDAAYGSLGKLQGISVFPAAGFFDGASAAHQHELGHQWLAFLDNTLLLSGVPHWPASTMAYDIMGLSIPGTSAGGRFGCRLVPEGNGLRVTQVAQTGTDVFNPLDLYLMGLLPAADVPDQWVITDPVFAANWQTMCDGRLLASGFERLSVADVIAANGPRDLDFISTQRTFRIATVVVSDGLLSQEAMSYYDFFAARAEARERVATHEGFSKQPGAPFFVATGGRGALIAVVDSTVPVSLRLTATEFYNPALNYYFITSKDSEKALLDTVPGWYRSGETISMLAHPSVDARQIVRFYFDKVAKNGARGSHFYTLSDSEIAALTALNPGNLPLPAKPVNEGTDSFAFPPFGTGATAYCAPGAASVYRLFRGNAAFPDDPNHRFTTKRPLYDQFIAAGWSGEGIVFCVPN